MPYTYALTLMIFVFIERCSLSSNP